MTDKHLKPLNETGSAPPGTASDTAAGRTDQVHRFRSLGAEAAAAGQFGAAVKAEEAAATILGHLKSSTAAAAHSTVRVAVLPPAVAEAIRQVTAPANPTPPAAAPETDKA